MGTAESNFKSQSLEPTNLLLFFIIAFGWTLLLGSLFMFGVLEMPPDMGTPGVDLSSAGFTIIIIFLLPFGPTISSFLITAKTKGREGVRALWKRFWNRKISLRWVLIIFLFYPGFYLLVRYSALFLAQTQQPTLAWLSTPWIILAPFLASILHGGLS